MTFWSDPAINKLDWKILQHHILADMIWSRQWTGAPRGSIDRPEVSGTGVRWHQKWGVLSTILARNKSIRMHSESEEMRRLPYHHTSQRVRDWTIRDWIGNMLKASQSFQGTAVVYLPGGSLITWLYQAFIFLNAGDFYSCAGPLHGISWTVNKKVIESQQIWTVCCPCVEDIWMKSANNATDERLGSGVFWIDGILFLGSSELFEVLCTPVIWELKCEQLCLVVFDLLDVSDSFWFKYH